MPTKEHKRHARALVETLESRTHAGPPVCETEIQSAREFLRQNDFSAASDYFNRLMRLRERVATRPVAPILEKRNYGGEAAGCWMQVQSIYDHVILSVCYDGEFNLRRGRVKLSHRFNRAGRIDFVELKLLRSLQPGLDGAIRKLLTVRDYPNLQKDWLAAEAFALRVLPQELILLFEDLFRFPRAEILGWLINIGHRTVVDLLAELRARRVNGCVRGDGAPAGQLPLKEIGADAVARPILEQAAALESTVESSNPETVIVRYLCRQPVDVQFLRA
jgi:hypothetical protein